jgi:hypothetical protein
MEKDYAIHCPPTVTVVSVDQSNPALLNHHSPSPPLTFMPSTPRYYIPSPVHSPMSPPQHHPHHYHYPYNEHQHSYTYEDIPTTRYYDQEMRHHGVSRHASLNNDDRHHATRSFVKRKPIVKNQEYRHDSQYIRNNHHYPNNPSSSVQTTKPTKPTKKVRFNDIPTIHYIYKEQEQDEMELDVEVEDEIDQDSD